MTNPSPPLDTPRVAARRRRRRRPLQAKVAFGARLVRPRNAGHVAYPSRGTHPRDRHAFIRAVETHRTAQARASPTVWLVRPERTQGEVFVRVPGTEGPLVKACEDGRWRRKGREMFISRKPCARSEFVCSPPNFDNLLFLQVKQHYRAIFRVTWGQGRMDAASGRTQKLPPGHACSTV